MQSIEAMLLLPDSRDRALAITQLELSRMMSNKAVAMLTQQQAAQAVLYAMSVPH